MAEVATVESPASTPAAVGGSKTANAPASAPAGTAVTHGTAGSALIAHANRMLAEEGASSASSQPGAVKPGDTSGEVTAGGSKETPPKGAQPTGQPTEPGAEGTARNPQLEARFQTVARNAQAKVLNALGLGNIQYSQLPAVAKEINVALRILRDLRRDTTGFHQRLGAELAERGNGNGEAKPFEFPKGRLRAEDGTEAYSVDQFKDIMTNFKTAIVNELMQSGQLRNVFDFVEGESERRASEEAETGRKATITSTLAEMRTKPHFKENEQDIVAILAAWNAADPRRLRSLGVKAAVAMAYNEVLTKKVYGSSYEATVEKRIRDEMRKKAGSTGVVDTQTTTGEAPKKQELSNPTQLAEHMRRLEQTMA